MPTVSQNPFWLFMHIPKAGGTTLRSIVDAQFGPEKVLTYYNQNSRQLLDNLPYVLRDERRSYAALIGHFSFGVHEGLHRPGRYVTILREPVARGVAAYFENVKTYPERFAKPDGSLMTLSEVLEEQREHFSNQQVKMIAGTIESAPADEGTLEVAERNLRDRFDVVGILERFDESVLLMSKRLQWRGCVYGRLNVRKSNPVVEAEAIETLRRINVLDSALYGAALKRHEEAAAGGGPLFDAALVELKAAIARHSAPYANQDAPAMLAGEDLGNLSSYLDPAVVRMIA